MRQALVAFDPRVLERRVLVAAKGKNGLIHLLGVEDAQTHQQMKILHRQAGDDPEKVRFELRDDVLERVFTKIREIHKRGNPRRELDQLFLNLLAFRLVLFLLGNKFLLLLCRQILARCLVLEFLDLFAFVNNSVDDVITKRPPGLSVPEKQGSAGPFANRSATGKANLFDAESVDG